MCVCVCMGMTTRAINDRACAAATGGSVRGLLEAVCETRNTTESITWKTSPKSSTTAAMPLTAVTSTSASPQRVTAVSGASWKASACSVPRRLCARRRGGRSGEAIGPTRSVPSSLCAPYFRTRNPPTNLSAPLHTLGDSSHSSSQGSPEGNRREGEDHHGDEGAVQRGADHIGQRGEPSRLEILEQVL